MSGMEKSQTLDSGFASFKRRSLKRISSTTSFLKMADNKGGFFAKTVQKRAFRAKEKLLQNLGKADKTTDELFDDYVTNFTKQQNASAKLHKEVKNYMACVKEMALASKSLHETLEEVYEVEWLGHDQLHVIGQTLDLLWMDYNQKLNEQVMAPLVAYQNQFPDVRTKIAKRGRRLVDYDSARHNLEALLTNTKKRDETKIAKAQEQLNEAKKMYEDLNQELHDELPALYDSRISFYASNFQTLGSAEATFHAETAKLASQILLLKMSALQLNNQMSDLMERLAEENAKGTYAMRRQISSTNKALHNSLTYDTLKDDDTVNSAGEPGLASFYDVAIPRDDRSKPNSPVSPTCPVSSNRESLLKSDSIRENRRTQMRMENKPIENKRNLLSNEIADMNRRTIMSIPEIQVGEHSKALVPVIKEPSTNNSSTFLNLGNQMSDQLRRSLMNLDSKSPDVTHVQVEADITSDPNENMEPAPDLEPGAIENYHGRSEYEPIQVGAQIHEQSTQNGPTAAPRTTTATVESLYSQPKKIEEIYAIPAGATTAGLPPGVLYKVRSTHKYCGEDSDELTFEVGDIIRVIEYDDPEDQDDGWLMGVKESTGQKGVFPANFTRPI